MSTPYIGSLIQEVATGRAFRLVATDPLRVALMPIGEKGWPFMETQERFQSKLGTDYLVLAAQQDGATKKRRYSTEASEAALQHGDETYKRFADAFSSIDRLLNPSSRLDVFKELKAQDTKLSTSPDSSVARSSLVAAASNCSQGNVGSCLGAPYGTLNLNP